MGSHGSKQGGEESTALMETLTEHRDSINCMAKSEDESLLVTGSDDKEARLWALVEGREGETECLGSLEGHTGYVTSVDITGEFVVTGSSDTTVKKWDMTSCECLFTYEGHTGQVMRVLCTGEYIISSSRDHTARVWIFDTDDITPEAKQRCCVRTLKGHLRGVHPIIYIPRKESDGGGGGGEEEKEDDDVIQNEELVITGSADNTARLWSINTGGCLVTYSNHRGPIMTMATDNSVRVLFTGSADTTIRSFDIRTGRPFKVFEGHTEAILCLSVVNKLLYSGDTGGRAKCWVWQYADCTCDYRGHTHSITCIKFHKGIVYTGSGDGLTRAFDAKTGVLRQVFRKEGGGGGGGGGSSGGGSSGGGGGGGVVVTCLSVCGGRLYTGSQDGKLRVWDISSRTEEVQGGTGSAA